MTDFVAGAVLTAAQLDTAFNTFTINAQTGTTYTLVAADAGGAVSCAHATSTALTVPPNATVAFETGTKIRVQALTGAGTVTITAGAGVTLLGTLTLTATQVATLVKTATNTWYVDKSGSGVRGARVYRSAALSINNVTATPISWDAETFDTDALHDTGSNPDRVILNQVGKWRVSGQLQHGATSASRYQLILNLNGAVVGYYEFPPGATQSTVPFHDIVVAAAITDYVTIDFYQNTGGALGLSVGSASTFLSVEFLG